MIYTHKYPQRKTSVPRLQQFLVGINATALQAGFVMISFEIIIYAFKFLNLFRSDITLKLC